MVQYVELTESRADGELLRRFYRDVYIPGFPDPDERESLENMERYLGLKAQGWYGRNNYHITIHIEDGKPVAGTVTDFLAEANAGVIEFLVVAPEFQHHKIGKAMLEATESLLLADAKQRLGRDLDCIVAEVNDPFKDSRVQDNLDPIRRTLIWRQWGYGGLDFPYVQPALSHAQQHVLSLLLIAKIFREAWSQSMPSYSVKMIVHEYLRWAMRLKTPDECAEYRDMAAFLDTHQDVRMLHLDRYLGRDSHKPIHIHKVTDPAEKDFAAVMSIYQEAFPPGPLTVEPQEFAYALTLLTQFDLPFNYHLWAIRTTAEAKVEGMASFFTFPAAGFGGYIAFNGTLHGTGRLRPLIARIEQQMLHDSKPGSAEGWYIETDMTKGRTFKHLDFFEVDVDYKQPPLSKNQTDSRIRLYYKPFGRVYGKPRIKRSDFLAAIAQIFRFVYNIDNPLCHPSFQHLETQVASLSEQCLRFR